VPPVADASSVTTTEEVQKTHWSVLAVPSGDARAVPVAPVTWADPATALPEEQTRHWSTDAVPVPKAVAPTPCWSVAVDALAAQKKHTVALGVAVPVPLPAGVEFDTAGAPVEQAESLSVKLDAGAVVSAVALLVTPKLKKPEQPGPSVTDPDVPGAARARPLARNHVAIRASATAASSKAVFRIGIGPSEGPTTYSLVCFNPHLLVR